MDYIEAQGRSEFSDGLGPQEEIIVFTHYVHGNPQQDLKNMKKLIEDLLPLEELKFNLFSVSQMCDKKNSVLFTNIECVILSQDFKLTDESHVLLKVLRKDNMYSVDLKNVVPQGGLTCLFAKAIPDESNLWHRRLGHVNFKTMNKLVRGNLVRGLPSKLFEINQTCVAFQKGKQHRASCIKNIIDLRVKVIRCDNGTEFKNKVMNQFCEMKDIKREFSVARTPQQNEVAERKNRTLIEASKTIKPTLSFMRPFGCPVTILNIIDHLDALTNSMNYKPVVAGNQFNGNARTKAYADTGKAKVETVPGKKYILLPLWTQDPPFSYSPKDSPDAGFKPSGEEKKKDAEDPGNESGNLTEGKDSEVPSTEEPRINQEKDDYINSTNNINTSSDGNNTNNVNAINDDEDIGAEADMNNLDAFMSVSPIPTTRIHKDHPVEQIIRDLNSAPQTRRMTKNLKEHGLFSLVQQRTNHKDFQNCLFACFLSQEEPKKVIQALKDPSTKWVYRNKKDERGIVIKNKARLVAQGYTQEEGIDYDEVFAPISKIEAIRLFLADVSFKDFVVYQMDVKSAFLYGKIEKEVYLSQPPGFEDSDFSNRMSSMGELTFFLGLQVKQKEYGIFISQDKYVTEILKKFSFSDVKAANTPMETHKPLLKDADGEDVDEHMYRLMIGSLMYLTSSRPDIMFVVYTDSDYARASLDRKSTIGGCQFLGCRLISWQCKKQTVAANSTTEAEYVAASSCCGQVLWIQN
ncbi:ribonuclease H-like domain-containing protein [Tanacetum coccineum]